MGSSYFRQHLKLKDDFLSLSHLFVYFWGHVLIFFFALNFLADLFGTSFGTLYLLTDLNRPIFGALNFLANSLRLLSFCLSFSFTSFFTDLLVQDLLFNLIVRERNNLDALASDLVRGLSEVVRLEVRTKQIIAWLNFTCDDAGRVIIATLRGIVVLTWK